MTHRTHRRALLVIMTALVFQSLPSSAQARISTSRQTCAAANCESIPNPLLWFQSEKKSNAVWAPFGTRHSGAQQFEIWVKTSKDSRSLPPFENTLSLNCWEYVLYSALKLQRISLADVKLLYSIRADGKPISEHLGATVGVATYTVSNSKVKIRWPKDIQSSDVVFMDETSHVVQLLGQKDPDGRELIVSFSPRPIWGDGSQERPVPNQKPEVTTVESLIEEMIDLYPDVPTDWNNIGLKIVQLNQPVTDEQN